MPDQPLVNSDLQSALVEARQAYIDRNPKSLARQHEAMEAMPGGNTRTTLHNAPFPLTVVRGEGCRLWDVDGHEYIDVLGEYTAGIYGHSHPVIRAAIDKALNHGWNYGGRNANEARLAKLVADRMPSIDLVRFTNSGTEGNVMALAGARVYAQRKGRTKATKVMVFHGGYHGGVLYFVSGGSPVNVPYEYIVAPYNDVEGTRALLAKHGEELFAVLLEPMQGSHGCLPGDLDFLKMVREETRARGITMIFDEVMTSRLAPGGLQEKTGVIPDMTTLCKYIGGGMSFGAFGGRGDIMDLFDPRRSDALPHAGTFNNNVLTMAAGLAGGEYRARTSGDRSAVSAVGAVVCHLIRHSLRLARPMGRARFPLFRAPRHVGDDGRPADWRVAGSSGRGTGGVRRGPRPACRDRRSKRRK